MLNSGEIESALSIIESEKTMSIINLIDVDRDDSEIMMELANQAFEHYICAMWLFKLSIKYGALKCLKSREAYLNLLQAKDELNRLGGVIFNRIRSKI